MRVIKNRIRAGKKMNYDENILKAREAIQKADAVLITSGAGMGVDSGLPDFRGNEGFWKAYPPMAKLGISFMDMANPLWFQKNPKLAWGFYGHRFNLYRQTIPHKGFSLLLNLVKQKNNNYFIFTSNVDGQFQRAGFADDRIEECHGSVFHFQCTLPCNENIWKADLTHIDIDEDTFEAREPFPSCPVCGNLARPNVLMFGDWLWVANRSQKQSQNMLYWLNRVSQNGHKLVVIECGAGKAVPTVRHTSESIARQYGGILIRINPRDYEVPGPGIPLPLTSLGGLSNLL
ncbi:MAG: Sir2 family NAD-dependent protein deacetylase [Calditrichaceae bacterium]